MQEVIRKLYQLVDKVTKCLSWTAPLVTRAVVGYTFYNTGYGKVHKFHATVVDIMVRNHIPFPEANAWFVGYLEWIGAMFLIVGLLTRPVAFMLFFSMFVAMMTEDRSDFISSWSTSSDKGPTDIASFVLFAYLIWLVWYGAGALSLDMLAGLGLRRWAGVDKKHED